MYDFIDSNDDDAQDDNQTAADEQQTTERQPREVRRWTLGDHTSANEADVDALELWADNDEEVNEDLAEVLRDAASMVEGSTVSGFECPECGLNHSHADHKHDIRSFFEVEADFADGMQYVPFCHCGVNELAMLVDFFHFINVPVFEDQDEFEGVLEADPEIPRRAYRIYTSRDEEYEDVVTWQNAIIEANNEIPGDVMPSEITEELIAFLERVHNIKQAADAAPIATETRTAIEETREELAEQVGWNDEDEWYVGEITDYNAPGGYGFIEADGIEGHVFFTDDVLSFDRPHPKEGEDVRFTYEVRDDGAQAALEIQRITE